jgi:hypothetical protein
MCRELRSCGAVVPQIPIGTLCSTAGLTVGSAAMSPTIECSPGVPTCFWDRLRAVAAATGHAKCHSEMSLSQVHAKSESKGPEKPRRNEKWAERLRFPQNGWTLSAESARKYWGFSVS